MHNPSVVFTSFQPGRIVPILHLCHPFLRLPDPPPGFTMQIIPQSFCRSARGAPSSTRQGLSSHLPFTPKPILTRSPKQSLPAIFRSYRDDLLAHHFQPVPNNFLRFSFRITSLNFFFISLSSVDIGSVKEAPIRSVGPVSIYFR